VNEVGAFRRLVAFTGVLGTLSIGLAATPAALVMTAAAAGGLCGLGPPPGPTQVLADQVSGLTAFAIFTSVVGTTETDIFVTGVEATVSSAGSQPTPASSTQLGITVVDTVTGITSVEAFGCTSTPDLQIDRLLTSATLAPTSITVFDSISNTSSTTTVSAAWTGVGDVNRSAAGGAFHSGNFTVTTRFVGFMRNAEARGSVSDPALGVSFVGPASYAELDSFKNGAVQVCVGDSC
jgi:hypothetical protein